MSGREQLIVARGPRVVLRRSCAGDLAAYCAVRADSAELHAPWITLGPSRSDPEDRWGFRRWRSDLAENRRAPFLVTRKDDDAIVGGIALSEIVRGDFQSAYCGYWGSRAHAGQGYMTEGLALLCDHAFGPMGLHRIEANIQPQNERSIALVKRVGFRREGFSPRYLKINGSWCDHERWALLADEWRELRSSEASP